MDICLKIKELRKSLNLSQFDFAESIDIKRSTLSAIELKKQKPTLDTIKTIVNIYNIPYNYFFEDIELTNSLKREPEKKDTKELSHKNKIVEYLTSKSISKHQFYKTTGLTKGFLDSGKSIDSEKIPIIKKHYPDLNIDWLLFNKGTMNKYSDYTVLNKPSEIYQRKSTDSDILLEYLKEKDKKIQEVTEEIGKLKEQIRALKKDSRYSLHDNTSK